MFNFDNYIERIENAKNSVKESIIISAEIGSEYLNAILGYSIGIGNIRVASAVFLAMKVSMMHEISLAQIELQDFSDAITLK